jgi:hypothetical protein
MEIPKTRKELFEILQQNSGDRSDQCSYLKDYIISGASVLVAQAIRLG